ncbi:MAG: peptide MFS transporter [Sphingomonadales bacterium]|jgi:POT family proton-dependent oligopeptide transporter|nr:peptide MFS transporter [Sphingomonadales bacterium]MBK9268795.1 peptide MFS transporter [Sphingomonadales bacterium]MBP6433617.1 peptide MFS transporter [Sphingorhabdus sp.]
MTIAEATPEIDLADRSDRAFLGHPKGLGYLAFVEGCERFSYYSMQTLLVLYMVKYLLLPENAAGVIGLDWMKGWYGLDGQPLASKLFGDYTSLVYLTPIAGGLIADRWLGRRTTLILGGLFMTLGHFLMAFESSFLFALMALIVGVGLFKGNIASQVGELYKPEDLRRAMAFQIFYIAINVSVIAAPLVAGTLGERVGWHWGFGTAGVVMVIGLILYIMAGPWLPADNRPAKKDAATIAKEPLTQQDWLRIAAVVALVPVLAVALLTNQQIFNAYLVWADTQFQLTFFGQTLPTSWMITIDATASFSMLAAVAAFYVWYGKRRQEPDELGKMIIGSFFTIAGGLCLYMAAATQGDSKIGLFWPLMFHILNSIGFAHILPVSLAFFTKLAPRALNATIIGIYYLSFFAANKIVGEVGTWYETMATPTFWLFHVGTAAVGLVAFVIFKLFLAKRLLGSGN